jgi:hypothetical protein
VDRQKPKKRITEADWVGIRVLYQLFAVDVTAQSVHDIQCVCNYYERKYGYRSLQRAFAQLVTDPSAQRSFDDAGYFGARRLMEQTKNVSTHDSVIIRTGEQHG